MIIRGDTEYWTITLLQKNGSPFVLNGCEVTVTYKLSVDSVDTLFSHTMTVGIDGLVTGSPDGMKLGPGGAASGVVLERLDQAESAIFSPANYVYDVQVKMPSRWGTGVDVVTPIIADPDTVVADITRNDVP